jgi:hypothetical protein
MVQVTMSIFIYALRRPHMFKSKFLANTLILSVIALGVVACSNDETQSLKNENKGSSEQDKLNKEMNEAKSLLGETNLSVKLI